MGQKKPSRLGSTICYGQELARKSHQDSAIGFVKAKNLARKNYQDSSVRLVRAKRGAENATKTQYDLLRPRVGQKKPPRLGRTIYYGQQKKPPRLGSTICYGQELSRKSHQDSAHFGLKARPTLGSTICYNLTRARKSNQGSAAQFVSAKSWPGKATEPRQYEW